MAPRASRVNVDKTPVPSLVEHADGRTLVVVTDPIGSVRRVVDAATGAVVQRLDYSPFGVVLRDDRAPGFDQPFRFAGGLWDEATGLLRFGARDVDPRLGRWTAKDPLGFAGGDTHLYAYVGSDPANAIDRTDLDADGWPAAASWLDAHGVDDFAAGFGGTLSFGVSARIRKLRRQEPHGRHMRDRVHQRRTRGGSFGLPRLWYLARVGCGRCAWFEQESWAAAATPGVSAPRSRVVRSSRKG